MTTIQIILNILVALVSVVLIAVVVMQEGSSEGLSSVMGGSETYFGKGKSKGRQGKLASITKVSAIVFMAIAVILSVIS
ncbi:MAG: preprotein translocase subunit SecG [Christensenellales bacterium]